MKCLTLDRLYDYLEGLLEEQEKKEVDLHLLACGRCRQVAEDRRRMLEASRTLPSLELPADFTRRVMKAAFPKKRPQPRWLWGLAAGLASLLMFSALLAVLSGRNWPELMTDSSRMLWGVLQSGLTFMAKAVRLIVTLFKVVVQLFQAIWEGLSVLSELITPATLALTLSGLILITAASYFGFRKFLIRR
jgi:AcrR family transcriptional regulator